ncbi:UNVERIFIED_CONTAM: putative mitochondrial protein [Sesamum latifolium]|uniref:Mitochondrial protein n=1 Tax=Sesamum latifolium TaxID=2727402 RepID=A0AAW2WRK8_9LAMI
MTRKIGWSVAFDLEDLAFCEALDSVDVYDLGFEGDLLTWCNRHPEPETIYERLDRACVDPAWKTKFPNTVVRHIPTSSSDHIVLLIDTDNTVEEELEKGTKAISRGLPIKCCMSTLYRSLRRSFQSFITNGPAQIPRAGCSQFDSVIPQEGLRQGDPLPHTCSYFAEAFSSLLQREERCGRLQGVAVYRQTPRVSHLLFADDTLIFCQATIDAAVCILEVLGTFRRAAR